MGLLRDAFITGFVDCAAWCGYLLVDEDSEPESPDRFGVGFTAETLATLREFAGEFFDEHYEVLSDGSDILGGDIAANFERLGHDLWLSSHGHGAGYFDRGSERIWGVLQDLAKRSGAPDDCFGLVEVDGEQFASL